MTIWFGAFTAAELFGLRPDAITFAKALGGGYVPIGAALLNAELAEALLRYLGAGSATDSWRAAGVARYVASGELGSGTLSNPVVPEAAAQALRDA